MKMKEEKKKRVDERLAFDSKGLVLTFLKPITHPDIPAVPMKSPTKAKHKKNEEDKEVLFLFVSYWLIYLAI